MNVEQAQNYYRDLAGVINPILNEILPTDEQINVTDPVELEEYLIELFATWFWQTARFGVTGVSLLPVTEFEKLDTVNEVCKLARNAKKKILKGEPEKAFRAVLDLVSGASQLLFLCGFQPVELVGKLRAFAEDNDKETRFHRTQAQIEQGGEE